MSEFESFLAQTDLLLVGLLPDTAETRGLIDARHIAMLPRGAGVLNAGRGTLIAMPDLIAALDFGHLSSAFLDVFEPRSHCRRITPAWRHPRINVTSHVAAFAFPAGASAPRGRCARRLPAGEGTAASLPI